MGNDDLVKLLLDHGADVNQCDIWGNTSLIAAACAENVHAVRLLLQYEANVKMKNNRGETALIAAASLMPSWKREQCINLLLDHDAHIEEQDSRGDTALIRATRLAYMGNVKHLLDKKANPEARDAEGHTPLVISLLPDGVGMGNKEYLKYKLQLAKLLLEKRGESSCEENDAEESGIAWVYGEINKIEQWIKTPLTPYLAVRTIHSSSNSIGALSSLHDRTAQEKGRRKKEGKRVKDETSLRSDGKKGNIGKAGVVPSQPQEDFSLEPYTEEDSGQGERLQHEVYQQESYQQESSSFYGETEARPSHSTGLAENADSEGAGRFLEVTVERIHHTLQPDEYVFKDSKNHRKSTTKNDWKQFKYNGETVWAFRGKKTTYISRKKIR